MYKTESMLGLIGSILGAIFTFLFFVGTLVAILFYSYLEPIINNILMNLHTYFYDLTYGSLTEYVIPIVAVCVAAAIVIAASSFILGFIGSAKLNRNDKGGGVLLIVGGALALISIVGFIPFVLMLVGGIMAVSKKPVSVQPELNKSV